MAARTTGQFFVPSLGPMPPDRVVRLLDFPPGFTEVQNVDRSGRDVGAAYRLEGRPTGWRFSTAAAAHAFVESRRSAAHGQLTDRTIRSTGFR